MQLPPENQIFNKKIIIVTPWIGKFSGGAENLAKSLAIEFNKRGIKTIIFSTCCKSPYDDWWTDFYEEGVSYIDDLEVHRFSTNKTKAIYQNVMINLSQNLILTKQDKTNFFIAGINSDSLTKALLPYIKKNYEIIALPYFQGLTHSVVNTYPNQVSIVPCFHDETQFYWQDTQTLLANAKHIFYNSPEEKDLTIKSYGLALGKKIIESPVGGVGIGMTVANSTKGNRLSLPRNYFIYVGKKDKGKNVDLLCQWFETYILVKDPKAVLVFVGSGDRSIVPKIKNFIDLGFLPEDKKHYVIKNALALINLSSNESFSIVLMEGWLLGVPAIVYQVGTVTTGHCRRANAGLYVENDLEFILALDYIAKNKDVAMTLGQNGKKYVKSNYSFDNVLSNYITELKK